MTFSSWRGVVGMINPTLRPGVTEEVIRLLPEGIGLIPLFLNIRRGTENEFETMMPAYEELVAVLAEHGCDLIHPHGAPPFMIQGRKREAQIVKAWEKKYKTPIMSVAQNHVNALKTLKAKTIIGATYFPPNLNAVFARYFRDAGFTVRGMEGIDVPFDQVQELSSHQVYAHIKRNFLKARGADAIYMLGSGWRTLDIIQVLEQDLQVPVVHPVTARVWEFGSACMCASRGKASAISWQHCRKGDGPWPTGEARRWSFCSAACAGRCRRRGKRQHSRWSPFTITMLVDTAPGGINDISARLVARHLSRFIPGTPNIIVQNNPGGGGLVTANRLYFNSEKNGSVLAKLERAVPQIAIQGNPNAQFDPAKITWLGSLSSYADDAYLMLINANHPAKTIADLKTPGMSVVLGADNAASSNLIFAVIAKEVLGLNVNVVRGYAGAAPLFLAMQRGELDGQMVGLSSVRTGQRDLWSKNAFRPLMGFGRTRRHREFPNMPIGRELTKDPHALSLIEFAELPFFMALPFAAPPDVPADRATALRSGFMAMCRDQAFIDEAEKLGIDMSPVGGGEILTLLARTAATPKDVIARYNAIGGAKN